MAALAKESTMLSKDSLGGVRQFACVNTFPFPSAEWWSNRASGKPSSVSDGSLLDFRGRWVHLQTQSLRIRPVDVRSEEDRGRKGIKGELPQLWTGPEPLETFPRSAILKAPGPSPKVGFRGVADFRFSIHQTRRSECPLERGEPLHRAGGGPRQQNREGRQRTPGDAEPPSSPLESTRR